MLTLVVSTDSFSSKIRYDRSLSTCRFWSIFASGLYLTISFSTISVRIIKSYQYTIYLTYEKEIFFYDPDFKVKDVTGL